MSRRAALALAWIGGGLAPFLPAWPHADSYVPLFWLAAQPEFQTAPPLFYVLFGCCWTLASAVLYAALRLSLRARRRVHPG